MKLSPKQILIYMAILIAAVVLIDRGCNKPPKVINHNVSVTDTIYRPRYIYDTFKGREVKPLVITRYLHDTIHIPTPKIEVSDYGITVLDTSYMNRLRNLKVYDPSKDTIAKYSNKFLVEYPKNSKLILIHSSMDTLSIDQLGTDGNITSRKYMVDYKKLNYQFNGQELSSIKNPDYNPFKNAMRRFTTASYISLSVNPFTLKPKATIDYSVMFNHVGVYGYNAFSTGKPFVDMGVGVKFKLTR